MDMCGASRDTYDLASRKFIGFVAVSDVDDARLLAGHYHVLETVAVQVRDGDAPRVSASSEQLVPDYASFDPNGLCCGTTATPRPTSLRGTTPPTTDADGCLACHACGGSADCPATSYCRGNGVCQGFPDYSSFDPRGECCARP